MTVSLAILAAAGFLIACGVYLMMERTLSRIILGVMLLSNGINLLFVIALGEYGGPAFYGTGARPSDPLPFAMVLTAIVITMGMASFVLALSHRNWQLFRHDEVQDDVEDRRVLRRRDWDEKRATRRRAQAQRSDAVHAAEITPEEDDLGENLEDVLGEDLLSEEDVPIDTADPDRPEAERRQRARRARGGRVPESRHGDRRRAAEPEGEPARDPEGRPAANPSDEPTPGRPAPDGHERPEEPAPDSDESPDRRGRAYRPHPRRKEDR